MGQNSTGAVAEKPLLNILPFHSLGLSFHPTFGKSKKVDSADHPGFVFGLWSSANQLSWVISTGFPHLVLHLYGRDLGWNVYFQTF